MKTWKDIESCTKKYFKNKTEEQRYFLNPRRIEKITSNTGVVYSIFDYGNSVTMHYFEVQRYVPRWDVWECVSNMFTDYGRVVEELLKFAND